MTKETSGAIISKCGLYRYSLTRETGYDDETALFIMLNPSTADASLDDPTIRRCMNYAKAWNFGRMQVVNLFAYRTKSPKEMMAFQGDTIGPDNHTHVQAAINNVCFDGGKIICAWGNHGSHERQNETMRGWIEAEGADLFCLNMNKAGSNPVHPLYQPKHFNPIPYGSHQEVSNHVSK